MLSEEQLEAASEVLKPYLDRLEKELITTITRELAATVKQAPKFLPKNMIENLKSLGYKSSAIQELVMREIMTSELPRVMHRKTQMIKDRFEKYLKKVLIDIQKENASTLTAIGKTALANDLLKTGKELASTEFLKQISDNFRALTEQELSKMVKNLTLKTSTGNTLVINAYKKQMDYALLKLASGNGSIQQIANESARALAGDGLKTIEYLSGRTSHIQDATRRTLQTQIGRMSGDISIKTGKDLGLNLVEVSAHWGARDKGSGVENHAEWQGHVYCIEPQEGYMTLLEATGYPDDPRGLKGYNCRHDFYPYVEGSNIALVDKEPSPTTVNYRGKDKTFTYYEATQQQRSFENQIRKYKRQAYALSSAGDSAAAAQATAAARALTKEYRAFSDAVGIRYKPERLTV